MAVIGKILKGAYYDSVTLMRVSAAMAEADDVQEASIVMGTQANRAILAASGMMIPEFDTAGDADLLIAVRTPRPDQDDAILDRMENALKASMKKSDSGGDEFHPASLDGALNLMPDINLALISVAGRYAGTLAMDALKQGLHVMIFSDNVPVDTERHLKETARERGLLVMGPDCGTAIINGVPLGFANAVSRGNIGIVAASGTGLQEVSCIISNEGGGISQAIGTGGHDLKTSVGGIMVMEGLKALAEDDETAVIVLISKPPDPAVMEPVRRLIASIGKPVVTFFLGAPKKPGEPATLEETALTALLQAGVIDEETLRKRLAEDENRIREQAVQLVTRYRSRGRFVRGLFSGGTFCSEAQTILLPVLSDVCSNTPIAGVQPLADPMRSSGHTVIDMGDDTFTVGRPHPMIDYSLRRKRIQAEGQDPDTGVILLDVVLGFGSNADPAGELAETIGEAVRRVPVICSVTGTDGDFQNRAMTIWRLQEAGAVIMNTNASMCRLALACLAG